MNHTRRQAKALRGLLPLSREGNPANTLYSHDPEVYHGFMRVFPLFSADWKEIRPRMANMTDEELNMCLALLASIIEAGDLHLFRNNYHPKEKK